MEIAGSIFNLIANNFFTLGLFDNTAMHLVFDFFSFEWLESRYYAVPFLRLANFLIVYFVWRLGGDIVFNRGQDDATKKRQILIGRKIGLIVAAFTFFLPSEQLLASVPWVLATFQVLAPILIGLFIWKALPSGDSKTGKFLKALLLIVIGILITNLANGDNLIPDLGFNVGGSSAAETIAAGLGILGLAMLVWGIIALIIALINAMGSGRLPPMIKTGSLTSSSADPLATKFKKQRDAAERENLKLIEALEKANSLQRNELAQAQELERKAAEIVANEAVSREEMKKQIEELEAKLKEMENTEKEVDDAKGEVTKSVEEGINERKDAVKENVKVLEEDEEHDHLDKEVEQLTSAGEGQKAQVIDIAEQRRKRRRQTAMQANGVIKQEVQMLAGQASGLNEWDRINTQVDSSRGEAKGKIVEINKFLSSQNADLNTSRQMISQLANMLRNNTAGIQERSTHTTNMLTPVRDVFSSVQTRSQITNQLELEDNEVKESNDQVNRITKDTKEEYEEFNKSLQKIWNANERFRKKVLNKLIKHVKTINEKDDVKSMVGPAKSLESNVKLTLRRLMDLNERIGPELINKAPSVHKQKLSQIKELITQDINLLQQHMDDPKKIDASVKDALADSTKVQEVHEVSTSLSQVITQIYSNSSMIKQSLKESN